jgi:hypothetical protein
MRMGWGVAWRVAQLLYFVRTPGKFVTAENIHTMVQVRLRRDRFSLPAT